jgi:predicted HTH domain antitoxin
MSLTISDDLLRIAQLTEEEALLEFVVFLFQSEKISIGKACQILGMTHLQFQHILAERQIPIHYGVEELEEDLRTIESLRNS